MEKIYQLNELLEIGRQLEKALKIYEDSDTVVVGDWKSYDHEDGVLVFGILKRQWVYFPQYKKEKNMAKVIKVYDWALWKALNKIEKGLND